MQVIEDAEAFTRRFPLWRANDDLAGYPWVLNENAPLTPVKRALPMLNLALISSAGAYIDGTEPFDLSDGDGDLGFREIPREVEATDLRYAAKGYDPAAVMEDRNVQIPIERLTEYEENAVIGGLNSVWWSLSPHIPNAVRVAEELAPRLIERLQRYQVQAVLMVPASRLCHQTLGIIGRAVELAGLPTIMISVDTSITERVRPPRTAYYKGAFGQVLGAPFFREYQLRVLDETLRWIETFDQPGARKLAVELESQVEAVRGER